MEYVTHSIQKPHETSKIHGEELSQYVDLVHYLEKTHHDLADEYAEIASFIPIVLKKLQLISYHFQRRPTDENSKKL